MDLDYLQALMGGVREEPAGYRNILVLADTPRGRPSPLTVQILGRARELADALGVRVEALTLDGQDSAAELISYGADVVYTAAITEQAGLRALTAAISGFVQERRPEIILAGDAGWRRDVAPRLAARLGAGIITGCIALDLDESARLLIATRPSHGLALLSTIAIPTARPQIATVRSGALPIPRPDPSRNGEIINIDLAMMDDALIVESTTTLPRWVPPLTEASVIVTGGRGMGGPEGFALLEELATLLGGAVGATRSAVEFGWQPRERLIDVTGARVQPRLYIAVGVSGSFNHYMAIHRSRAIVAITTDPHAPIVKRATWAVIADWRDVIPGLITHVRQTSL